MQGKSYVTTKGKLIPAKTLKPPSSCKSKCFEKIDTDQMSIIFENFYKLESEGQNQFISNNIEEYSKKTERIKPNSTPSRRQFSRKYFLTGANNVQIEVCQVMFLNTLTISLKKVRVIMAKKKNNRCRYMFDRW